MYPKYVLVAQWIERLVAVQKVAGSIPAKDTEKYSSKNKLAGIEQERGRENGSFPGVDVLKPQGFKERSEWDFLPRIEIDKIKI